MKTKTKRVYTCSCCGRRLKQDRWVWSQFTRSRYCWPGEGCNR